MGLVIKRFADGSYLEYDYGSFDEWCVYYTDTTGVCSALRDEDYFTCLMELAEKFGANKVYGDFVSIYYDTAREVNNSVLEKISAIAGSYGTEAANAEFVFAVLYATMVAEENKAYTKLGKKIKRLGVHMLLWEGMPIETAANCMRGRNWKDIDNECRARGF